MIDKPCNKKEGKHIYVTRWHWNRSTPSCNENMHVLSYRNPISIWLFIFTLLLLVELLSLFCCYYYSSLLYILSPTVKFLETSYVLSYLCVSFLYLFSFNKMYVHIKDLIISLILYCPLLQYKCCLLYTSPSPRDTR